jgi:hypothetical protein
VRTGRTHDRIGALILFIVLLVVYNSNGREIGSYDTQPTKFAARELLLRGTLDLDDVVAKTPQYATRWGFMLAADGHYRSVYSPLPAIMTATLIWPLWKTGIIDVRAQLAPGLMAKVGASVLVAAAVVLCFFTARRWLPPYRAMLLAIGLGLGTGFWSTASQTLWQTETAVFGLALAVFAFTAPERISAAGAIAIGLGLGLAGATRPQLGPLVGILLLGVWMRTRWLHAAMTTGIIAIGVAALCAANLRWFGHPLGALPLLQEINSQIHATGASFGLRLEGFAGLLVSPNRGLLVYSPVALVPLAGMRASLVAGWRSPLPWCAAALAAEYVLYAIYAVWWGGHTYGPRYLVDVLPVAVPLAAVAMAALQIGRVSKAAAAAALAWSIVVAATGAFCYPNERWNVDPVDVDRNHERLWSVSDNQIRRCWTRGMSPQNFSLFDRATIRVVPG